MRVFSRPGFNPLICKLRRNLPSYSVAFTESQNLSAKDIDGGLHSWLLSENPLSGFLATSSTPDYGKSGSLGTIHLTISRQSLKVSEEAISTADKSQEIPEQCIGFQLRFSFLQSFCLVSC